MASLKLLHSTLLEHSGMQAVHKRVLFALQYCLVVLYRTFQMLVLFCAVLAAKSMLAFSVRDLYPFLDKGEYLVFEVSDSTIIVQCDLAGLHIVCKKTQ